MAAIDNYMVERLRNTLQMRKLAFEEKKMFGGVAFMVNSHMTVGVTNKNDLMVRCKKESYHDLLTRPGAHEMLFTGKPMAGFLFVDIDSVDKDEALNLWIEVGLEFSLNTPPKKK